MHFPICSTDHSEPLLKTTTTKPTREGMTEKKTTKIVEGKQWQVEYRD